MTIRHTQRTPRRLLAALTGGLALVAAGCSASDEPSPSPTEQAEEHEHGDHDESEHDHEHDHEHGVTAGSLTEVAGIDPRLVLTFDGGIMVVDTAKREVISTINQDGFLRLDEAGDGRHLFVANGNSFTLLDAGITEMPHGDHSHYFAGGPTLTDVTYPAIRSGHVVSNAGLTALFDDGAGQATVVHAGDLHDGTKPAHEHVVKAQHPHHGVAVPMRNHQLLMSVGTEDERTGVQLLDMDGDVLDSSDECPGIHGAAVAGEDGTAVGFGCSGGPVVFAKGAFHKIAAEGRSSGLYGSPASPVILANYTVGEEPSTEVALIDTDALTLTTVDLGETYGWTSFARGHDGDGLVLTHDGKLQVIDVDTGKVTAAIPVTGTWAEKDDWQEPNNTVVADGPIAYVTEVATKQLHLVDLTKGEVVETIDLPEVPNAVAVITGMVPASVTLDHDDHDDLDDHDHEHGHDEHGDHEERSVHEEHGDLDDHGDHDGHEHGDHDHDGEGDAKH
ncbi:MAG: hypothetical protein Q4P33_01560 [Flaviflexus sp.]|nr:hypothetical protein [Flaviflexus sp.]